MKKKYKYQKPKKITFDELIEKTITDFSSFEKNSAENSLHVYSQYFSYQVNCSGTFTPSYYDSFRGQWAGDCTVPGGA